MLAIRQHQKEAVKCFEEHFESNSRGTMIMCCGSGKTFTMYNIIKSCIRRGDFIFVIATSYRLLVDQLASNFLEWLDSEGVKANVLLNYSGAPQLRTRPNGYKYENYGKFENILEKGVNIILSTFDSTDKLFTFFTKSDKNADLIIMDECHNTAGQGVDGQDKMAQRLIKFYDDDHNFRPAKILFSTATPLSVRNANPGHMSSQVVYSMDNEDMYGGVFYEYSFARGIRDGYIVDWQTIMLDCSAAANIVLSKIVKHSKYDQRCIYFTALADITHKTIAVHNLRTLIIYFGDTKWANYFGDRISKYEELEIITIHSKDDDYKENIRKLKNTSSDKVRVVLTVSMFDEGVDIPSCDSVLFADERKSETTIVQNIGRALRPCPGKTIAKVIIPSSSIGGTFKEIKYINDLMKKESSIKCTRKFTLNSKPISETDKAKPESQPELSANGVELANELSAEITPVLARVVRPTNVPLTMSFKSLAEIGKFMKDNNISEYPHESREFISYAKMLDIGDIYGFDECRDKIKELREIHHLEIFSVEDFYKKMFAAFAAAIGGADCNSAVVEILLRMPIRPSQWYRAEYEAGRRLFDKIFEDSGNRVGGGTSNVPTVHPDAKILSLGIKSSNKFCELQYITDLSPLAQKLLPAKNRVFIALDDKNRPIMARSWIHGYVITYNSTEIAYKINLSTNEVTNKLTIPLLKFINDDSITALKREISITKFE